MDDVVTECPQRAFVITLDARRSSKMRVEFDPAEQYWPVRVTLFDDRHQYYSLYKKEHFVALRNWLKHLPLEDGND